MDTMARVAVGHVEPESVEIIQPRTYKPSPCRARLQNTLTSRTLTNKKRGGGGKKCITVSHISWSSYAANNWTEAGKLWRKNMQQVIIGHVRVPIDSELDSGEEEDTGSLLG